MQIVEHSAELLWITPNPEQMIAKIARTCYKSEDRDTPESNIDLIKRLLNLKHLAMFDHASASIKFVTDRGITHELVRHRMAGYAQESTRYCNYSKNKFGHEITVIKPIQISEETPAWYVWAKGCKDAELNYFSMLACGASPQTARSMLPTCVKTEIVMTCDFTEWMHVFKLRRSPKAHPDMQYMIGLAHNILKEHAPNVFKDAVSKEAE